MMFNPKQYWSEFRHLSFLDKHAVANVWGTMLLAAASLLLGIVVFRVTTELQHQSNTLQRHMFVREQNERNIERLKDTVRTFAIEDERAKP